MIVFDQVLPKVNGKVWPISTSGDVKTDRSVLRFIAKKHICHEIHDWLNLSMPFRSERLYATNEQMPKKYHDQYSYVEMFCISCGLLLMIGMKLPLFLKLMFSAYFFSKSR